MTYLQKYTKWFNIGFTVHPYDGSSSTSGESLGRRSNELIGNRNAYLHSATSGVLDMHVQIKKTNGRGKEGLRHQRMPSVQCLLPPPLRHKSNHKLRNGVSFSVQLRNSLQKQRALLLSTGVMQLAGLVACNWNTCVGTHLQSKVGP